MELSFDEALEKLGITKEQLRQHVKDGRLQAFAKVVGGKKRVCFKGDDIENFSQELGGLASEEETPPAEEVMALEIPDEEPVLETSEMGGGLELDDTSMTSDVSGGDTAEIEDSPMAIEETDATLELEPAVEDEPTPPPKAASKKGAKKAAVEEDVLEVPGGESGSETISFDLDDGDTTFPKGDSTLSLDSGDDTLSLSGEGETLTEDEEEADPELGFEDAEEKKAAKLSRSTGAEGAIASAAPATKIVPEPMASVAWTILTVITSLVFFFIGYVSWGIIHVEGAQGSWGHGVGSYQNISEFVKKHFYYPTE